MRRFFCPPENINDKDIRITDAEEIHHISHVIRLAQGDGLIVFDGQGNEYEGIIEEMKRNQIAVRITARRRQAAEKTITVILACAIPQKGKFDTIVEKATELGVDTIIPLATERTVVSLSGERSAAKQRHWQAIALSAAKQCQRNIIPQVRGVTPFGDVVNTATQYDKKLFFCIEGERKDLKDAVGSFSKGSLIVFIGPEGDFSEREIAAARKAGCEFVSLGPTVLKVDTAAIAVLSVLNFLFSSR